MGRIKKVTKQTDNRFLNMYALKAENRKGGEVNYFVASRWNTPEEMKLSTKDNRPDGMAIYSLYGEKKDKIVLIRQYRYPLDGFIYEFPAGLVEPGEDYRKAAIREMKEETGLTFHPIEVPEYFEKPFYTTIGMTDECCGMVYGWSDGEISLAGLEDTEELDVVIVDREEAKRILKEENVAIMCAYMLMHFIADEDPFKFLK